MCFGGGGDNKIEETADQRELAEIGLEQFDQYMAMYPDVENQFFEDVERMNTSQSYERGAGYAATNVSSAYSDANQDMVNSLTRSGVNPNSGTFTQAINTSASDEGTARFNNANQTQQAIQDSYLQGKSNIVSMGQGLETQAIQGMGNIAAESGRNAINDAYRSYDKSAGKRAAIATGVGAGLGAWDGYRNSREEDI